MTASMPEDWKEWKARWQVSVFRCSAVQPFHQSYDRIIAFEYPWNIAEKEIYHDEHNNKYYRQPFYRIAFLWAETNEERDLYCNKKQSDAE